ncbi:hypothetical protein P3T27_004140 [Kitasatospora sp. MAA19]|uniref:hypothetical protein n=1 Tax=Kitasatospora sp. MAA19 TaxID=3035090 RepID=UPI00247457EC|nr:hypothetical protein [Kitasatospora sp. MAA19]MDH6707403.1 hypothetical protein [Kitasatospora sp. MAA19]
MSALRDCGITFEEYDFPGLTTVNGLVERDDMRAAWFKDSEGNIRYLAQSVGR